MFDYLWHNFHVSFAPNDEEFFEEELTVPEDEVQEEVIIKLINNMMEDMDIENEQEQGGGEQKQQEEDEQQTPPHQAWYLTISSFIDHVNRVSQKLCKHPGWRLLLTKCFKSLKENQQRPLE
jgi:hypothetical protein